MTLALNNRPRVLPGRTLRTRRAIRYAAATAFIIFAVIALSYLRVASSSNSHQTFPRARLSEQTSARAAVGARGMISLGDGHELLSPYQGEPKLQQALEQNEAQARALAAADFDEDGVPDLAAGYALASGGIVTVHRGNADSIYPNAPEAQARRKKGTFTAAPFLSPARALGVPTAADFLGAGDFDADGHWDIVLASRGGRSLFLLPGDGKGNFAPARETRLNGSATSFVTGELNRRDGLTDVVVGIEGKSGAQVLVFEGPDGALKATPEVFAIPTAATALVLGQLDDQYAYDLAIAAGPELHVIYGRDRKLSLDAGKRAGVLAARKASRKFDSAIRSLALGDFVGSNRTDIALLTDDGAVHLLGSGDTPEASNIKAGLGIKGWRDTTVDSGAYAGARELTRALVSSSTKDDLLISDGASRKFRVLTAIRGQEKSGEMQRSIAGLDLDGSPAAVLPMRLDRDALHDLVVLRDGRATPIVMFTGPGTMGLAMGVNNKSDAATLTSFSNLTPITTNGGFSPPTAASLYPSNIVVSGVVGTIDKLRVKLNDVSSSNAGAFDVLLVGPGGQKVMLISDIVSPCAITNAHLGFEDNAALSISGSPQFDCTPSGTYKPTDVNSGADTFAAPAPAGPYSTTLSSFDGTNPNGTWSLYVVHDSAFTSAMSIAGGWALHFGPDTPANFVVTNTNNSGAGSLNQAVIDANANFGADNITFNIPGPGPFTISPTSLFYITDPVTIDGTTQPGFAGTPIIELAGGFIFIRAGRTTIRGLVMNQTVGTNILIRTNGNNIIEGNYLGTDRSGTAAGGPLGGNGVEIDSANNLIGGTTAPARNVIGNKTHGVMFATFDDAPTVTDDASNNLVQGNYIGLNAAGTAMIPISHAGVTSRSAPGSPNNTVGGTIAGARNVISGDSSAGIDFTYSGTHGCLIQGNYIGTDATGTQSLHFTGSNADGVFLSGGTFDNTVGGTTPGARNVISGNTFNGVFFVDSSTSGNLIQGNFIGTDVTGTQALDNQVGLRMIFDASLNTIGGATASTRNIISGNSTAGIQLGEPTKGGTLSNLVQGNYIGTDVTGELPLGNGGGAFANHAGIIVPANARGDRIEGNRIAYNNGHGIRITNVSGGDVNSIEIFIVDNLIYANQGLGIDLGDSGITPNDLLDTDSGPNQLQNFPELTSTEPAPVPDSQSPAAAIASGVDVEPSAVNGLKVNGILKSAPNTTFTVHWFFSTDSQCTTNQAATRPLVFGKIPNVSTDSNGNAPFSFPFDFPIGATNGIINCTASDPQGNTSEFSACLAVGSAPTPTPTPTPSPSPSPTPTPLCTTTFTNAGNIAINDGGFPPTSAAPYPATINVSNLSGTIGKVTVRLTGLTHTFPDDIDILLVGPGGQNMILASDAGGGDNANNLTLTFDDTAASALPDAGPLVSGTFRPGNFGFGDNFPGPAPPSPYNSPAPAGPVTLASVFNGVNPNGNWTLYVVDDETQDSGAIAGGWSLTITTTPCTAFLQFSSATYSKAESGPSTNITVTRTGDTSGASSVNFGTGNNSYVACNQMNGTAVQNCDFILSSGTLNFAAGQTSKTFPIIILEDWYGEGNETISLTLSSPTGAVIGSPATATLTITDNDSGPPAGNPLDDPPFYVRQHYYDFLGRLPDDGGMTFWTNEITQCGTNQTCINERRVAVSNAFFFELEYQQTATYVFLLYRAGYGNNQPFPNPDFFDGSLSLALKAEAKKLPRYLSFVRDRAQVVGGANLAQTQLALANAFVQRPEFITEYPSTLSTGAQFVDAVLATIQSADGATLEAADRTALITHFNNGGRGLVMFHLANDYWNDCHRLPGSPAAPCVPAGFGAPVDNRPFIEAEYNRAFVYSQYSGYLRRDGDINGFLFWLTEVSKSPPRNVPRQRAMVCSFMTATEYQQRLSPVATHNNSECPPPP